MRNSLVFAAALACALAMPAVSHAEDASLDQFDNQPAPCANGSHCLDQAGPQSLSPASHLPTTQLNPQPLPPGVTSPVHTELNPQPLPPGMKSPYQTELNPQPLPPGAK